MKTEEFTPGPWSFDGPASNIHVRQAVDPNIRICFMTSDGPTRANASLIAAAPDMLTLLREIYEIDAKYCSSLSLVTIERIGSVIAQAEGTLIADERR